MRRNESTNGTVVKVPANDKTTYNTNTVRTQSEREGNFNSLKARRLVQKGARPTSSNMDQKLNYADSEDWYFQTSKKSNESLRTVKLHSMSASMKSRQSVTQSQFQLRRKQRNNSPPQIQNQSMSNAHGFSISQLSTVNSCKPKKVVKSSHSREMEKFEAQPIPSSTTAIQTS